MSPNPQETADLVKLTEEILNGKPHFLYSADTKEDLCPSVLIRLFTHQISITSIKGSSPLLNNYFHVITQYKLHF